MQSGVEFVVPSNQGVVPLNLAAGVRLRPHEIAAVGGLLLAGILISSRIALAQAPRPTPPTRDPHSPGYVEATELPDGAVPPPDRNGNFILGPTHAPLHETQPRDDVPKGKVHEFVLTAADSRVYPTGIARDPGTFGTPDPADPAKLVVSTSRPAPWTRTVSVFVPSQYVAGTVAPFIVVADGPNPLLFATLETLIARGRIPVMVGIAVGNGGGDAQGSQRGLEYDTLSPRYAEFIETDVLPQVERVAGVRLTGDPDLRATMGCSSGAAAAFTMAWYRNDLYHRVLCYSGTFVNQQWPSSPETPGGAWEYHARLVPRSPRKPIRIWMHVGDRDLLNPNAMRDGMHDWVEANERMAKALAARGYAYQFAFARNAGHCDRAVTAQTLPAALEWLWRPAKVE
jgi:enterochelin esterase family protein